MGGYIYPFYILYIKSIDSSCSALVVSVAVHCLLWWSQNWHKRAYSQSCNVGNLSIKSNASLSFKRIVGSVVKSCNNLWDKSSLCSDSIFFFGAINHLLIKCSFNQRALVSAEARFCLENKTRKYKVDEIWWSFCLVFLAMLYFADCLFSPSQTTMQFCKVRLGGLKDSQGVRQNWIYWWTK